VSVAGLTGKRSNLLKDARRCQCGVSSSPRRAGRWWKDEGI